MTSVTGTGATAGTAGAESRTAGSTSTAKTVDYDAFLQLLIAQMKNQDPMDPAKSTEYVAQLASFSQVEQSIQVNKKLDAVLVSSRLQEAASIRGATITSADGATTGTVVSTRITSEGVVAVLQDGSEIKIEDGVRLGSPTS